MADTLKLEIVTPESKIYAEDVEMVTQPGSALVDPLALGNKHLCTTSEAASTRTLRIASGACAVARGAPSRRAVIGNAILPQASAGTRWSLNCAA